MRKLCLIGGVSAVGKTETIKRLANNPLFAFYKFHQAVKGVCVDSGINLESFLDHLDKIMPLAVEKYVDNLKNGVFSLSDIHYAVQPKYDLSLVLRFKKEDFVNEPYVCGVEDRLIDRLFGERDLEVRSVLLTAPLNEIIERRLRRAEKQVIVRSLEPDNIKLEQQKEQYFFGYVCNRLGINKTKRLILDNPEDSFNRNEQELTQFLKG